MNLSIYFIGSLFRGSTSNHRLNAVKKHSPKTVSLDQDIVKNDMLLIIDRVFKKLKLPTINSYLLNEKVISDFTEYKPEIVWIDKGVYIYPKTLK